MSVRNHPRPVSPFDLEGMALSPTELEKSEIGLANQTYTDILHAQVRGAVRRPEGEDHRWSWRESCDGHGVFFEFKPGFGEGISEIVDLGDGAYLRIRDSRHNESIAVRTRHDGEINFCFVLSGGFRVQVGNGTMRWVSGPSSYATYSPGSSLHYSQAEPGIHVHMVTIFFRDVAALSKFGLSPSRSTAAFLSKLTKDSDQFAIAISRPDAKTINAAREIIDCAYEGTIRRLFFAAKARELACRLIGSEIIGERLSDIESSNGLGPAVIAQLAKARIEMDLSRNITGKELADELGISRNTLMRNFKSSVGRSIHAHLYEMRMQHALILLQDSSLSITDIALSVGYEKPGSFTDAFRSKFGVPPSKMRDTIESGVTLKS